MTRTITFYTLFLWLVFWLPGHAQLPISFTNGLKSYHPFNGDFYAANHNPVHHNKFVSATFGPDSNGITNNSAAFGGTQRINMYKGIIDDDVSSFSVDFWFRATGSGSQVLFWEGQINQQSVWIRIEPGQNRIRAIAGTLTNFVGINTPGMYNTGAWFHFALTAEKVSGAPDTMRTYINGQAMALATGEWSSSSTTNFTRIGTRDNISQHLIGNVDDLRVWSRPLAASEIQALYQQPRIVMGAVPSSAVCAGGTFSLPFTVLGGSFETGNAFHAQLSDDQGSFIYPISIGSLSGTTSGVINVQVPQNISTSSNYRLRIIATHLPRVSENVDTLSFTNPNALPGYDTFARLLMHYPLDGNGNDISGNGNNRSLVNSWQPRSDRFGTDTSAVYFGSSGRMTVGRPYVLDRYHGSTQPISFSFWYKTTAATNAIRDIFTCFSAGANNGLYIGTTPSSRVRFRINGGSSIVEAAYANNNVWTHFACVYTGSQLQIFRNGNLIQSTNSSGSIQITRGAQMGSNSDPFNALAELFGTLDDFRMYGRALNTNEVNLLYDNGHASSNSPFCYQDTVQFMATSFPGLAYNWSGPQAFQSNQQNPVLGPFLNTNQSGNYGLVLSYNGCVGDTNFTPVQPEVPPVVIAPVVNGCIGDTLLVTVSGATSTNHYHWFADSLGTLPIVDSVDQLLLSPLADTVVYVQIQPGGNCLGALTPIPITVLPPPSIGAMANSNSLCTGDTLVLNGTGAQSYIWNQGVVNGQGFAPSSSATYTVVGTDSNGCTDSTSLFVPVFPTSGSTLTTMACDSFVLNGQSYFTTGTYTQVLSNSQGCDSLITLNLTLFNSGTFLDTVVVCAGDSLGFGSQTLTASGNYSETFATVNGCDSVVQLH
ncbi:MAG: LamG-like jellyroll fold domain-containing protein, partial [Salibacteraceae bacterium]